MKYFMITKEKTKEMLIAFMKFLEKQGLEPISDIILGDVVDKFLSIGAYKEDGE